MSYKQISPQVVVEGGTGVATLTDNGVLVGSGTSAITVLTVGATGEILAGSSGADPAFTATPTVTTMNATTFDTNVAAAAVTLTGTTLAADGTDVNIPITITPKGGEAVTIDGLDYPMADGNAGEAMVTDGGGVLSIGVLTVPGGGTGLATLTDNGVLLGSGTGAITPLAGAANGQLVIGSTGADPVIASLTSTGASLTITEGAGTLNADIAAPVSVANGGTGLVTITDNGVMVGSGTAAVTPLAVGTTGQLLVGITGADPAFGASADADFTFTSSTAAATRSLTVTNTDNTSTASHAQILAEVGGTAGGDPFLRVSVTGGQDYSFGVENSGDDDLVITDDADPSTGNELWNMTSSGERIMPLQPAFLANHSVTQTNITGDGTLYTVLFDTEVFDQGGDFASNTFTAPVAGRYLFTCCLNGVDYGAGHTAQDFIFRASNRDSPGITVGPAASIDVNNRLVNQSAVLVDMDAGDTCIMIFVVYNSTKTIDLRGNSIANNLTNFSGYLVC